MKLKRINVQGICHRHYNFDTKSRVVYLANNGKLYARMEDEKGNHYAWYRKTLGHCWGCTLGLNSIKEIEEYETKKEKTNR